MSLSAAWHARSERRAAERTSTSSTVQLAVERIEEVTKVKDVVEQARKEKQEEDKRKKEDKKARKKEGRPSLESIAHRFSGESRGSFFGRRSGHDTSRLKVSWPFPQIDSDAQSVTSRERPLSTISKGSEVTNLGSPASDQHTRSGSAPKRPARPSLEHSFIADSPPASPPTSKPPPIPEKSPYRKFSNTEQAEISSRDALAYDLARLDLSEHLLGSVSPRRAITAPAAPGRTIGHGPLTGNQSTSKEWKRATVGESIEKRLLSTVQTGKIDKRLVIENGRSRELALQPATAQSQDVDMEEARPSRLDTSAQSGSNGFMDRDLPGTPGSILHTPTEMYASRPAIQRNSRVVGPKGRRRSDIAQRRVLAPLTDTNARINEGVADEDWDVSPTGRLAAVPEFEPLSENTPPRSGTATPIATEIHLRGGSVVTVVPPEVTAWKRSTYIQGPIRLLKPKVWPRMNSVASLEPFQNAVEQANTRTQSMSPRRTSEDRSMDDVCEWFDEFGLEEVSFEGDTLNFDCTIMENVPEMDDEVSPIDRTVAKEVVMSSDVSSLRSRRSSYVSLHSSSIPSRKQSLVLSDGTRLPVMRAQTAEDLRVRGIARLSRYRKQSIMSTASSGVLPITPLGEETMFQFIEELPSAMEDRYDVATGGIPGPDRTNAEDVDEMDCDLAGTPSFLTERVQNVAYQLSQVATALKATN